MRQGCYFTTDEVNRILNLLSNTDLSTADIAARLGCSKVSVGRLNRLHRIRNYSGRRTAWEHFNETRPSASAESPSPRVAAA